MALCLDDCSHCACQTALQGYSLARAIEELESGQIGCWNCLDQQDVDPDGHYACVALYDDGKVVWDGRCGQ